MDPIKLRAVVTGAGSGIGECIARSLAQRGATVALVGRRKDRLEQIAAQSGGKAHSFPCDVTDPSAVRELHDAVRQKLGAANLLINAAGVFNDVTSIAHSDPQKWIETIQINTIGPYLMCRQFLPGMIEQSWGRIANVSSAAAIHPPSGTSSAYQLSKVALNHFTRQLAQELAGTGVTANAMHPGEVKTEMWAQIKAESEAHSNQGMLNWAKMVEQSGGDPPQKTVDLILDLLRPENDNLTGQFLWIKDGIQKPTPTW